MARPTFLAWHNLTHDRPRTAVAVVGVGFSLVVIFLQLGFSRAVEQTATIVLDRLDYDILVTSRHYRYLADAKSFPRVRIRQAESVEGVASVVPLYVRSGSWHSLAPPDAATASGFGGLGRLIGMVPEKARRKADPWPRRSILVLGIVLGDRPFRREGPARMQNVEAMIRNLERPSTLLIDEMSRKEFGPQGDSTRVELNRERFEVVGRFKMGTGFAADGSAMISDRNFARAYGPEALEHVTLGLVRLKPGVEVSEVARRLRSELPSTDVKVMTRPEIEAAERNFWIREKSIGVLFKMGVYVSFLVGLVLVYQVLSSDIADHLGEYATLKAIGHTAGRLSWIVIQQGLILGLIGYAASLAVAFMLYRLVEWRAQLPMELTPSILCQVLLFACLMTGGSALVSIRKVNEAEPADLFR